MWGVNLFAGLGKSEGVGPILIFPEGVAWCRFGCPMRVGKGPSGLDNACGVELGNRRFYDCLGF